MIARHGGYGDMRYTSPIVRNKPRLEKTWQRQLAIVESIPWMGGRYAGRLLKNLGTVKAVFNASPTQLTHAAGIPPATAAKIHRLINQPYREIDRNGQHSFMYAAFAVEEGFEEGGNTGFYWLQCKVFSRTH